MKIQMGYVNCPCYSGWGQVWHAQDWAHVQMHAQLQVLAVLLLPAWIMGVHGLLPVSSLTARPMLHHGLLTMEAISVRLSADWIICQGDRGGRRANPEDGWPSPTELLRISLCLPLLWSLPELMQFPCTPRWPNAAWKLRKEGGRERGSRMTLGERP